MVHLLLLLTLHQAPVGVGLASKRPGVDALAPSLAVKVAVALEAAGVQDVLSPAALARALKGKAELRSCNASAACLARIAALLGPRAVVVGVDVGKVAKTLAVHLEAISAEGGRSLAVADVTTTVDGSAAELDGVLSTFSQELLRALRPSPPPAQPPVADAPVAVKLEPTPVVLDAPVLAQAPPARGARVLPWVLVGTAAVAAGLAAGFGVSSLSDKAAYNASISTVDGVRVSSQTDAQLQALAGATNTKATVALTSGLFAVALAAAGAVLFATGD